MSDFVTLTCPKCGGKLQITPDIVVFACAYCGTEHLVRRGAGIISLNPVVAKLSEIQEATDRTSLELKIRRFREEIAEHKLKITELCASASRYDFIGLLATLRRINKLGTLEYWKISREAQRDYEFLQKLMNGLNASEMEFFLRKYSSSHMFMNQKTVKIMLGQILFNLQEVEKKGESIESYKKQLDEL